MLRVMLDANVLVSAWTLDVLLNQAKKRIDVNAPKARYPKGRSHQRISWLEEAFWACSVHINAFYGRPHAARRAWQRQADWRLSRRRR